MHFISNHIHYSTHLSIYRKVKAVEKVFNALDSEISLFQTNSELRCVASCGKCCTKPDIEASVLEFLPFAYHVYKEGRAEEILRKAENADSAVCVLLQQFLEKSNAGFCGEYRSRGLICRLFGFSARTDKNGIKDLVTCSPIKSAQPIQYEEASSHIASGNLQVPVMSHYFMMLYAIDYQMASKFYPINEAIRLAIETVLSYYSYRSKNAG